MLYFSRDYTPHDHRFLAALAESEHEAFYLRLQDAGQQLERRPVPAGIQTLDWWGGRRRVELSAYPRAAWEVGRVIASVHPDVVHAGPVQSVASLVAWSGFSPQVTMSWGSDLLKGARSGTGRWVARYTLARSEVLACDCHAVKAAAVDLGMPAERIAVFPWGVDLGHFSPDGAGEIRQRLGWGGSFVVLSSRTWAPVYGVDVLVDGFILAARSAPDLRLLMLGDGPMRDAILSKLHSAGVTDRVHLAGQVDHASLPDYYRSADLYVSASHSDGSSISLLEAMACGLPALVSNIPGNREWVEPGRNGGWFADSDPKALADAILEARSDHDRLRRYGQASRDVAQARADWRVNSRKLMEAYQLAVEVGRA